MTRRTSQTGTEWSPFELGNGVEWLWWLGVINAAVAVFALAFAVYPRTVSKGRVVAACPTP